MMDSCSFEELADINDAELRDGLWDVLGLYYNNRQRREKALEKAGKIVDLYTNPILDGWYGIPRQPADHYRTRSELVEVSNSPKIIDSMIEYGLLELHPKWPIEQKDHPQAPYRPVVSAFVEARASVLWE